MGSNLLRMEISGFKSLVCEVKIGDLLLLLGMIVSVFAYGSWQGLTGAQLVAIRMAIAIPCLVVIVFRLYKEPLPLACKFALAYSTLVFIQGCLSRVNPGNAALQGIVTALVFLTPYYFARRYGAKMLLRVLFWVFLVIVVVMDGFAIATNGNGILTRVNEYVVSSNYLFGDKFQLSYINMLFFALLTCCVGNWFSLALFGSLGIFVCSITACSTGIVGILIMAAVIALSRALKPLIGNKFTIPLIVVAVAFVAVAAPWLMELPPLQNFVINVLGESPDFTGRMNIYPQLVPLWFGSPLLGYGSYGAANSLLMQLMGAPNAQEGLFHILLSNGLVGGLLFLAACTYALSKASQLPKSGVGLYAYVLAMAFCSLVEINLGLLFILGLSLVFMTSELNDDLSNKRLNDVN